MLQVSCPNCSQVVQVPETALGKKGRCPACREIFTITDPSAKSPRPAPPRPAPPRPSSPPVRDLWYVVGADGSEKGPFSGEQLKQAYLLGKIAATTSVRRSDSTVVGALSASGILPAAQPANDMSDLRPLSPLPPSNPYGAESSPLAPLPESQPYSMQPAYSAPPGVLEAVEPAGKTSFWSKAWPLCVIFGVTVFVRMVFAPLYQLIIHGPIAAAAVSIGGCCGLFIPSALFGFGLLAYYFGSKEKLSGYRNLKTRLYVAIFGEKGTLFITRLFGIGFVIVASLILVVQTLMACLAGPPVMK